MSAEDRITHSVVAIHRYGSPELVLASRAAMQGGAKPAYLRRPTSALMLSGDGFGADAVTLSSTGYVPEIIEVKRGGARSTPFGPHHPAFFLAQRDKPNGKDPDGVTWWQSVQRQMIGPDGRPYRPSATRYHPEGTCGQHNCEGLPHEGNRPPEGQRQQIRLGLPQPPVYLYCDWLRPGLFTDRDTILIVLGGTGTGGPGQPVLDYYDTTAAWCGPRIDRFILTPHPTYLDNLASAFDLRQATDIDRQLVQDCATAMWLDTDSWEEADDWPAAAHDLVHADALDNKQPWTEPKHQEQRRSCNCKTCQQRRAAAP